VVDFTTDEGTWMSVDVSPDGRWILFDLLAHIYRVHITGGDAVALTQNSGVALNFDPAYSPDGRLIAFISDRTGQNNVWVMNADGSEPLPVFVDLETRFTDPVWAPDGKSIVAVRAFRTPGRGWHRQTTELWRLPLDASPPTRLLGGKLTQYEAPSFSRDGRYLYFHVSYSTGEGLGMLTAGHRLQRLELATGQVTNVRSSAPAALTPDFEAALKRTGYAADVGLDALAALVPTLSPDGKTLAFAQEVPGETVEYRGHQFQPRTALFLRRLDTGLERKVMDPITKDLTQINAQYAYRAVPAFAWTPDGRAIVISEGGKLQRLDPQTGRIDTIPFRARVRRELSEQTRGRIGIDDSGFEVKFIQWPVGSPDGRRLAFVAVGKVWIMDLPGGTPRPLTSEMARSIQLTPAWSPDSREIAFTSWDDRERGHLWKVEASTGKLVRLTTEPGEYLHPVWTPDGTALYTTRGPGPAPGGWNGWNSPTGWTVVWIPASGGPAQTIDTVGQPRRLSLGAGGRLFFEYQEDPSAAAALYQPFPPESALRQVIRVRSIAATGGDARDHLRFPARLLGRSARPIPSPDGSWVAFESAGSVWVVQVGSTAGGSELIDTDPNPQVPGRVPVGRWGGTYPSWRDSTTLQLASGSRYITYDARRGQLNVQQVWLRIPRRGPSRTIALVGAKIITIDSGKIIPQGTVIVRSARIACVGVCDTTGVDRVLDLRGKVIIPGLVDVHAHHTGEASGVVPPRRASSALDLAYGVTTILDPAAQSESAFPLAEMIEAGVVIGPRTFSTAELVITAGHAWGDQVDIRTEAEAAFEVNRRADWGAASIKSFRQTRRAQNQMLLAGSRARGVTQTGEGGPLYFDVGLALDGQTGWEHFVAPFPLYRDVTTFFGRAGVHYSPTVIVAGHPHGAMEYHRPRQELALDPKYRRFMPGAELDARTATARVRDKSEFSFPFIAEGLADIVRSGGYGAIGEHGEQYGVGSHWEIWAYAEALTPLEALTVATLHGAHFIGLDRETGSIAVGKLADLVVLNSDPLENIRNTVDIAYVMKAGRLYDDDTLAEVWPDRREYLPVPWE